MPYQRDYSKVAESSGRDPVPAGKYIVKIDKIAELKTKESGLPLIKVRYKIAGGEHVGRYIFDQIVLFPDDSPGAGIAKHFLHVIGEPYEGQFSIDPKNWLDRVLDITVKIDEQYNNNKVVRHDQYEDLP